MNFTSLDATVAAGRGLPVEKKVAKLMANLMFSS